VDVGTLLKVLNMDGKITVDVGTVFTGMNLGG
jgi:hypothetical protein